VSYIAVSRQHQHDILQGRCILPSYHIFHIHLQTPWPQGIAIVGHNITVEDHKSKRKRKSITSSKQRFQI